MRRQTPYSPEFIEKCFVAWYSIPQRPMEYQTIAKLLPKDDHGRQPKATTVKRWCLESWIARADELDKKAIQIVETDLVSQKVLMLQRQAEIGFQLQELGMRYLTSGSFDSASAAVQAVIRGAELERQSRGIGEIHARMVKMTDAELESEIIKKIQRASEAGQIIEGEEIEEAGGDTNQETSE